MSAQLPLALRWPGHQRFEAFRAGENAVAVELLRAAACEGSPSAVHVAGPKGSGRTHLLIAACAAANETGRSAQYLPLASRGDHDLPLAIRAFGGSAVLAIDDADAEDASAGDAEQDAAHALTDALNGIDPDALSPREALEALYRLKQLLGTDA